jgi:hypothetical protein
MFGNFHPRTSPVLWRILLAQAHIYQSIMSRPKELKIIPFEEERRIYLDWRAKPEKEIVSDDQVLKQPFEAVESYLERGLDNIDNIIYLDITKNRRVRRDVAHHSQVAVLDEKGKILNNSRVERRGAPFT